MKKMMQSDHIPVLLNEYLNFFSFSKLHTFLDGTLGAGGHASAILQHHPEIKRFIGFDKDQNALKIAKQSLTQWAAKIEFVNDSFENLDAYLKNDKCDGMFFDLGMSSMQLASDRGFSFQKDAPLDMRMNQVGDITAADVINEYDEKTLATIFKEYGEEPRANIIAKTLVQARKKKPIKTTFDLSDVLRGIVKRRGKLHPLTKVFQALRICVNNELEGLKKGLKKAVRHLEKNGRIGVISFHSLEDRIVKNCFKEEAKNSDMSFHILTKKTIVPSWEERKINPRARSAKLRFGEIL
jgi:16S rRNA (cytosine1402-N4)-methyltransferase